LELSYTRTSCTPLPARFAATLSAARAFFGAQAVHLGIGAAQFEGKHRLQVFALAENIVTEPVGEARHRVQRRFCRHVVNRSGKNFLDIMLHEIFLNEVKRWNKMP